MGECGPTATVDSLGGVTPLVIADGGMRANCNWLDDITDTLAVIADGGMRANCN